MARRNQKLLLLLGSLSSASSGAPGDDVTAPVLSNGFVAETSDTEADASVDTNEDRRRIECGHF